MNTRFAMLLCMFMLMIGTAVAHENEQHIMGTVTAISANSITVRTVSKPPKEITVFVVASTKFVRGEKAASLRDLKVEDRVVIHAKPNADKKLEATTVEFGKPATEKTDH